MFGYFGKFLHVDLDAGEMKDLPITEEQAKDFLGGAGLSAKLIYSSVKNGMDPMGADNPLVFAAGPFVGTPLPMVSRSSVCGISPQSGFWGEATTGGVFPFRMKAAGYDGIFLTGKAKKPVYLYINNGKAEIKDASHLWGKDSYETQEIIKKELNQKGLSISCIGVGGENLVKFAAVMNDAGRAAGRTGMGALMGSKNLKAVAVTGNCKVTLADEAKVRELAKKARATMINSRASMFEYGTLGFMDTGFVFGDTTARYFTRADFPIQRVNGTAFRRAYTMENYACFGCPTICGKVIKNFRMDIAEVDGPEYETVGMFGSQCWNFDKDSIIYANHLCNVYGIDTITAGSTIAYAMYLFEKGILTEKKAGMKIEWGDARVIIRLLEMMVKREGIGDLLAEGSLKVAKALGADTEEVAQVKGLEIPMHDPRSTTGMAISYATGSRGACHLRGNYYGIDLGGSIKEYDIKPTNRFQSEGKAPMAARLQNYRDIFDSIAMCKFSNLAPTMMADMLNAITGWNCTADDLNTIGERSMNIKRAISNKLGVTRSDDHLPRIVTNAMKEGSTAGKSPNMDVLLKEYYEYRQWDWVTGKPKKEKLIQLGLIDAANDLWG
ncbi:MAG: aldehyde ferredoxin oxidoreductase family protein [Dehalococcoidales bacterium]|nr:aldehyde ferredoxin oxidoreductase family protein [Dehalococcoidales bacterium]